MSERHDPVEAAIQRGDATARLLIANRDKLFEPMAALIMITGEEGLRACALGVAEAVIQAHHGRPWPVPTIAADEARS